MSSLAADLARALDPVALAEGVGMMPDPWQANVMRTAALRVCRGCAERG